MLCCVHSESYDWMLKKLYWELNQKKKSFERSTSCMCFENSNITNDILKYKFHVFLLCLLLRRTFCIFLTTCLPFRFCGLINIAFCWLYHFYEHLKIQIGRFNSLSCGLKISASKHVRNTFLDVKFIFILCSYLYSYYESYENIIMS